jgi:hypothetical protein
MNCPVVATAAQVLLAKRRAALIGSGPIRVEIVQTSIRNFLALTCASASAATAFSDKGAGEVTVARVVPEVSLARTNRDGRAKDIRKAVKGRAAGTRSVASVAGTIHGDGTLYYSLSGVKRTGCGDGQGADGQKHANGLGRAASFLMY